MNSDQSSARYLCSVALDCARARALERSNAYADALRANTYAHPHPHHDHARGFALVLALAFARSVQVVAAHAGWVAKALEVAEVPGRARVAVCAGWLLRAALRVVPAGERGRYGEEWRGELWDLAAGAGRRRRQTRHAMRLVVHAWPVRAGVREGRRRPAGRG